MNQCIENLDKKCEEMSFEELKEDIYIWLNSLIGNEDLFSQSAKYKENFDTMKLGFPA